MSYIYIYNCILTGDAFRNLQPLTMPDNLSYNTPITPLRQPVTEQNPHRSPVNLHHPLRLQRPSVGLSNPLGPCFTLFKPLRTPCASHRQPNVCGCV